MDGQLWCNPAAAPHHTAVCSLPRFETGETTGKDGNARIHGLRQFSKKEERGNKWIK